MAVSVVSDQTARTRGVSVDDIEVQLLLEGLVQYSGYDFRSFDPSVIKRRVESALSAEGLSTISELQGAALHDDACLERLLATLSRRQLSMFAEPTLFRALRATIVPLLRTYPFVRVWNAGCSTGEEAFALAIMLEEEGIYERCRIYATDAVDALVDAGRAGAYDADELAEWQQNYVAGGGAARLSDYFRVNKNIAEAGTDVRRNIVFAQHNVVSDGSFNEFHLIFCPGLTRQFNKELQSRVHGILHDSIIRLGFLALARDESVALSPYSQAYRALETDASLFRRTR
jgi:chemotaxis protein methyltransferase CheR